MWEGSYGSEPFDLRLTVLRLMRNLNKILGLTVAGALLFGGGYYVKNVLLRPDKQYAATSTYKVLYVDEPTKSGDYYVNEATWNTLVRSQAFLEAVQKHLQEQGTVDGLALEELSQMISAKLPSDWNIPTTTVVCDTPEKSLMLASAVERAMTEELVQDMMQELAAVQVIDGAQSAVEVPLDVRPVRALVLSAILSCFFATVLFLLKELGDDAIWLPFTLRRRYGLSVLGTLHSVELRENWKYFFENKQKCALCAVDASIDPKEVLEGLREYAGEEAVSAQSWITLPTPLLCPEVVEELRKAEGILLAVRAGAHAGKQLEYVLEYLAQQNCKPTAVLLWDADELLLRAYYGFGSSCINKR